MGVGLNTIFRHLKKCGAVGNLAHTAGQCIISLGNGEWSGVNGASGNWSEVDDASGRIAPRRCLESRILKQNGVIGMFV